MYDGCGTLSAMSGSESNGTRPAGSDYERMLLYRPGQRDNQQEHAKGFLGFATFIKQRNWNEFRTMREINGRNGNFSRREAKIETSVGFGSD